MRIMLTVVFVIGLISQAKSQMDSLEYNRKRAKLRLLEQSAPDFIDSSFDYVSASALKVSKINGRISKFSEHGIARISQRIDTLYWPSLDDMTKNDTMYEVQRMYWDNGKEMLYNSETIYFAFPRKQRETAFFIDKNVVKYAYYIEVTDSVKTYRTDVEYYFEDDKCIFFISRGDVRVSYSKAKAFDALRTGYYFIAPAPYNTYKPK
jgi:hypothetical protein